MLILREENRFIISLVYLYLCIRLRSILVLKTLLLILKECCRSAKLVHKLHLQIKHRLVGKHLKLRWVVIISNPLFQANLIRIRSFKSPEEITNLISIKILLLTIFHLTETYIRYMNHLFQNIRFLLITRSIISQWSHHRILKVDFKVRMELLCRSLGKGLHQDLY
jgi:hypothetical protein